VGLTILVVALARPQTVVSLPRIEGTVILAFDVSGSMAAADLQPTRMEAAKNAARAFVERQPPTVQIGVVAFSDSGFATRAPTSDRDVILDAINRLAPQRGTSLGQGIQTALNTIASDRGQGPLLYSNRAPGAAPTPTPVPRGTHSSAVIVMLTDGENNARPDPLAVAQSAADRGVRIYTVGIGSAAGSTLKINGFTVHTRLDEELLRNIARVTDGSYFNATSAQDLRSIYDNLNPELVVKPVKTEITSVLAGASMLILLIGAAWSFVLFGRFP
jgi:Ca-activated chloride channel family protein